MFFLLFVFLLPALAFAQTLSPEYQACLASPTFYMSPSGSGATCDEVNPCDWAGIKTKFPAAIPPVNILVEDGLYTGLHDIRQSSQISGTSAAAAINICARNDGAARFDNPGQNTWIVKGDSNFIRFFGLTITGGGATASPFNLTDFDNVAGENCMNLGHPSIHTGSADAGSSGAVMIDAAGGFPTPLPPGSRIYNTTEGGSNCSADITSNTATSISHGTLGAGPGCTGNGVWNSGESYRVTNPTCMPDNLMLDRVLVVNTGPLASNSNSISISAGAGHVLRDVGCWGPGRKCISLFRTLDARVIRALMLCTGSQTTSDAIQCGLTYTYHGSGTRVIDSFIFYREDDGQNNPGFVQAAAEDWHEYSLTNRTEDDRYGLGIIKPGVSDISRGSIDLRTRLYGGMIFMSDALLIPSSPDGLQRYLRLGNGGTLTPGANRLAHNGIHVQDYIIYADPAAPSAVSNAILFSTANNGGPGPDDLRLTNIRTYGNTAPIVASDWVETNRVHSSTLTGNPYTDIDAICHRHDENGNVTSTGMWPLPIEARMNTLLVALGRQSFVASTVVSNEFGAIPTQCLFATVGQPMPFATMQAPVFPVAPAAAAGSMQAPAFPAAPTISSGTMSSPALPSAPSAPSGSMQAPAYPAAPGASSGTMQAPVFP